MSNTHIILTFTAWTEKDFYQAIEYKVNSRQVYNTNKCNGPMKDLDIGESFLKNCIIKLDKTLAEISDLNTRTLLNGKNTTIDSKRKEAISRLQENPILQGEPDPDGFEPRIRLRMSVTDQNGANKLLRICSKNAVSFSPIWDEKFFYCRSHLIEGTSSETDNSIPSRDYALFSFSWENLIAVNDMDKLCDRKTKLDTKYENEKREICAEIFMFGLLNDSGKTIKKHISLAELLSLFSNQKFKAFCKEEGIDYLAYKIFSSKESNQDKDTAINHSSFHSTTAMKRKTYVIFVDSLDRHIIESKDLLCKYPNLHKIANRSTLFNNYTSSGFWTFPCLHAIQSGIPPYLTGSFMRLVPQKLFASNLTTQFNSFHEAFVYTSRKTINSLSLTKYLKINSHRCAAIKATTQTTAFWKLLDGVDISIESASCELVATHLKRIKELYGNFIDCYFIDIDPLHKNPTHVTYDSKYDWKSTSRLDWINKAQTKENRLLGIRDLSYDEKKREHLHLCRLDRLLGEICDEFEEDCNLILYSDNGSQIYENKKLHFSLPDSSATPEKIFQPTLLISSPDLDVKVMKTSSSLISSSDLFSIISTFAGIDENILKHHASTTHGFDSILPSDLGGSIERSKCISFGLSVKNQLLECIIRDKDKITTTKQVKPPVHLFQIEKYINELFPEIYCS